MRSDLLRVLRLVVIAALLASVLVVRVQPPAPAAATGGGWTTYHLNNARDGNDTAEPAATGAVQAWGTPPTLDGPVYAEPLYLNGVVYSATENDTVYAINAATGAVNWSLHLGTPGSGDPADGFPCGNVHPIGITSTPVIDSATNRLYAVGLIDTVSGTPRFQHHLWAIDITAAPPTTTLFDVVVDATANFDPLIQNQRGALALANNRIYIPFGGRAGDCGNYHGFVTSVLASNGTGFLSIQETANREGGSWAVPGPAVDGSGSLYVSTGNGDCSVDTYDHAESINRLDANLNLTGAWAPTDWHALDCGDTDIGSMGATLLGATGLAFIAGKNGKGYLVSQANLNTNGPGTPAFVADLSSGALCYGSAAYDAATSSIYVPCSGGLRALHLNAGVPSFTLGWFSNDGFADSPILAGGLVWWMNRGMGGRIQAFYPGTGSLSFSATATGFHNFSTPSAGGGRVYAPVGNKVVAYKLTAPVGGFHPVTPFRLLDTRTTGGPLGPAATRSMGVSGGGSPVPPAGVGAVAINMTVAEGTAYSYVTIFPAGQAVPTASNVNFAPGQQIANLTQVALGQSASITVYNSVGFVQVILDIVGWYGDNEPTTHSGLFRARAPSRVMDTRSGIGGYGTPFGPNISRVLDLSSTLPDPSRTSAVVVNLTAVDGSQYSYLQAYPNGVSAPLSSNLNFPPHRNLANRVIVGLGTLAAIVLYNSQGSVNVVVDLVGWYTNGQDVTATGGLYHPALPSRILDTRPQTNVGPYTDPFPPNTTRSVQVGGQGAVSGSATAAVLNVGVTGPTSASYLTVSAGGGSGTSDLNFQSGETLPNLDLVGLAGDGSVSVYNNLGYVDVFIDASGWFD